MSSLFLHVINLICVPVGLIWKLDLEQRKRRDFVLNLNFSKIRIEHVMLKFLATTQNIRK